MPAGVRKKVPKFNGEEIVSDYMGLADRGRIVSAPCDAAEPAGIIQDAAGPALWRFLQHKASLAISLSHMMMRKNNIHIPNSFTVDITYSGGT